MNMIQGDVGSFIATTNSKCQKTVQILITLIREVLKKTEYMICGGFFFGIVNVYLSGS